MAKNAIKQNNKTNWKK